MSRQPAGKLDLTELEFEWVTKTIARKARIADKATKNERLIKIIRNFDRKLEAQAGQLPPAGELVVLKSSRHEARILQEIAKNTRARLIEKVIPGYIGRMAKDPELYKPYLAAAQAQLIIVNGIINKAENAL